MYATVGIGYIIILVNYNNNNSKQDEDDYYRSSSNTSNNNNNRDNDRETFSKVQQILVSIYLSIYPILSYIYYSRFDCLHCYLILLQ